MPPKKILGKRKYGKGKAKKSAPRFRKTGNVKMSQNMRYPSKYNKKVDLAPTVNYGVRDKRTHKATNGFFVTGNKCVIGKTKYVSPIIKGLYPRHRFRYVDTGVMTNVKSGTQLVNQLDITVNSRINDPLTKIKDLLNEDPTATTGYAYVEASATTGASFQGYLNKMYLEDVYVKLRLASNQQASQRVEILPVLARQSCSAVVPGTTLVAQTIQPLTYWNKLIQQHWLASNAWPPTSIVGPGAGELGYRPYGKQFKKEFEKFYKCLTPMKFVLDGGQNTVVNVSQHVYKQISMNDLLDYQNMEGVSLYLLVFSESIIIGNLQPGAVQVSTASTSLMYGLEVDYYVRVTRSNRGMVVQPTSNAYNTGISSFDQGFIDVRDNEIDGDGNDVLEA